MAAAGDGFIQHRTPAHFADVLPEVADSRSLRNRNRTLVGILLAHDQTEDGGFAGAVGADEAELFVGIELEGRLHEEDLPSVSFGDVGKSDHGVFRKRARRMFRMDDFRSGHINAQIILRKLLN